MKFNVMSQDISFLQTWGMGDVYYDPGMNPFLSGITNEPKLSYFSVVDILLNTTRDASFSRGSNLSYTSNIFGVEVHF